MAGEDKPKQRFQTIVSGIDGETLIETVYRPEKVDTAFVIAEGHSHRLVAEMNDGYTTYVPVRSTNNLIKHQAILLPSEPAEFRDASELLEDVAAYIRRYVALSNKAIGLSSAYVLLTWVYDAFNELPYLRFRGDYGTGKTRALLVIGSLCYKAFFASGASTVSPIFHTLDTFKGTLVFDEADFRFTDEKAELVKILNNGNAKGFPVLRTRVTPKKEFDPQAFAIFGPKIVGMRRSYDDRALESRFLTIEMGPGQSADAPINLPDVQKDEARTLRNKLLTYRLRNRLSVCLDPTLADASLEPRMNQILLPLLSVIPDAGLRGVIRDAARGFQAEIVAERAGTAEGQVVSILAPLMASTPTANVSLADITAAFAEAYGAEYERPVTNRWIGGMLRRLGFALYKSHGVFVLPHGQDERLAALCARYGVGDTPGTSCAE